MRDGCDVGQIVLALPLVPRSNYGHRIMLPIKRFSYRLWVLQLASIKMENDEGNRRTLRELLFTAPDADKVRIFIQQLLLRYGGEESSDPDLAGCLLQYISGVIMFEETLFQKGIRWPAVRGRVEGAWHRCWHQSG